MNGFEERLETELVRVVEARTPQARGVRRRAWRLRLGAVAGVAAAAVAVPLVLSGGGGGTPAYAVVEHPDGTLTVTINDTRNPAELERKLADYGVTSKVTAGAYCRPVGSPQGSRISDALMKRPPGRGNIFTIDPRAFPPDAELLLGIFRPKQGDVTLAVSVGLAKKGAGLACYGAHVYAQPYAQPHAQPYAEPAASIPPTP